MRNWNSFFATDEYINTFRLRAYLWGIETQNLLLWAFYVFLDCEPTYEELKQGRGTASPATVEDCEPTYEELKQSIYIRSSPTRVWLRAYLWGIETKPLYHWPSVLFMIASLPMRNWNKKKFYAILILFQIASLPMRNWNRSWLRRTSQALTTLQAYLWGIETIFSQCCCCNNYDYCEPTYEELKHIAVPSARLVRQWLRAYLWGIETLFLHLFKFVVCRLRAYLWGIETRYWELYPTSD